jgi:hypothetical protein
MFYKTFGRPVFKVFLMAMFTYQMLYLAWVRLEHGEEREQRQGELRSPMHMIHATLERRRGA